LGQRATSAFQNANPGLMAAVGSAQGLQGGDPYAAYRSAISPQNDYASYVNRNQDLLANWQNNTSKNTSQTIEQYGQQHYDSAGRAEGRGMSQTPGGKSFGDLTFQNAQASLLGNAPQVQGQGYNAALTGPAQNVSSQNINAGQVNGGLLGMSLYDQALRAGGLGELGTSLQGQGMKLAQSTGAMTPDEARVMEQQVRQSYGARGTLDSSGSVSAEALGRLTNERQNRMNDLGMAGQINAQNQAELGANRGFQQNVQGAELGRQFQNVGYDLQAQGQNQQANMQAQLANQGQYGQFALANQASQNQAGQYGASAANQAALANQGYAAQYGMANQDAANQFGLYNSQQGMATQDANRQFAYGQYNQGLSNLGILGQFDASNLNSQRQYAMQLAQMQSGMASDPFQAILGRSSGVLGFAQGTQGQAGQYTQGLQGPQLFDPNAGINLALQNSSNQGNYQASTYGARAAAQGAASAGRSAMFGSMAGGLLGGAGAAGGFGSLFCWVAREVYGIENPKWLQFRHWMLNDSPSWFRSLYVRFGERFAAFISNKPRLKKLIRRWMDSKIN